MQSANWLVSSKAQLKAKSKVSNFTNSTVINLRLLLVHNFYLLPGGEDQVYRSEIDLLREHGIDVHEYSVKNTQIAAMGKLALGINTVWSRHSFRQMEKMLKSFQPDLVHFHNIFPLLSPSVYYACQSANIPVVQTLHNFRLLCPSALLLRNSKPCQDCLGKFSYWPGIRHSCYRNSYAATAGVATMLAFHRLLSTWNRRIDRYIALTKFARQKFIEAGLPAEKLIVKPNFIHPDPGAKQGNGLFALYVGRLSPEKGAETLIRAWGLIKNVPLQLVGDGPQRYKIQKLAQDQGLSNIIINGQMQRDQVISLIKAARFLVFPSLWYEGFPLVIAEAFACGVPVIASRLGAMGEMIEDGRTGLLFKPGDVEDLADKVKWAWDNPHKVYEMGLAARKVYEKEYSAERNYQILMDVYSQAISNHRNWK
jgi:glycosyltransferase involved in cell wall biosynthesis